MTPQTAYVVLVLLRELEALRARAYGNDGRSNAMLETLRALCDDIIAQESEG